MAREAMKNPVFREYVLTYQYTIPETNKQPTRYLYNTNRLIYDGLTRVDAAGVLRPAKYEGATGIKTGYTPEAGGCLVASAEKDGSEFITVVLKSTDMGRFGDSIALLDFAFANYKSVVAVKAGADMGTIPVRGGAVRQASLMLERDGGVTLPREASEAIVTTKTVLEEKVKAPVTKGQKIGVVEVYEGDVLRDQVPIIATAEIPKGTILSYVGIEDESAYKVFFGLKILGASLGGLILILLFYVGIRKRQIQKKKRLRQKKLMELARERNVRY
jgi:D-alanyl-D-alanine carboxypeptidase (penicillin-binding protein 5/6)